MCSCDGLGPEQASLESGHYVPRVTDWNLKMMPNLMKSKKPVSRMFLKLRLSVHCIVTDLQADFDCRNDQICPEFFTQKAIAIYYTLSVTSWTRRRPQPLSQRGRRWWLWRTCTSWRWRTIWKFEHTRLERTSCEKKWTDRKTFYIRLNSRKKQPELQRSKTIVLKRTWIEI